MINSRPALQLTMNCAGKIPVEPRRHGSIRVSRVVSYLDRLVIEFSDDDTPRDRLYGIHVRRPLLRDIFPASALAVPNTGRECKNFRAITIYAAYDAEHNCYRCELPRTIETYLKYRTNTSYNKDIAALLFLSKRISALNSIKHGTPLNIMKSSGIPRRPMPC